jgi:DNA-binding protein YbaB
MAKEVSKLGKEIEDLKKRLQASKKHLRQTELKAEGLNTLIEVTRRTRESAGEGVKSFNKGRGK